MTPPTRARTSLPSVPPRGARPGGARVDTPVIGRCDVSSEYSARDGSVLRSTCPTDSSNSNILVPRSAVKVHTAPARGALEMPAVVESATFPPQLAMNNPAGASAPLPGRPRTRSRRRWTPPSWLSLAPTPRRPTLPPRAPRPVGWWVRAHELHAKNRRRRRGRPRSRLGQEQGLSPVARATRRRGVPQSGEPRRASLRQVRATPTSTSAASNTSGSPLVPAPSGPVLLRGMEGRTLGAVQAPGAHGGRRRRVRLHRGPSRIPVGFFDHVPTLSPPPKKRARSKPRRKGPRRHHQQPRRKRSKTDARRISEEKTPNPPSPPRSANSPRAGREGGCAPRRRGNEPKIKVASPHFPHRVPLSRFRHPGGVRVALPVRPVRARPRTDRVNRSVWVKLCCARPFRDEVEACLCQPAPEVAVAMLAARETAEAAAAAKRGESERRRRRRERAASGRIWVGKRGGGSGCVAGKVRGGRGSECLRRGGGRSGADGLRRGVFQSFVPHDVRPARVSLRALVQQPAVSSADVAEDEDRADGASRVGSLRDGARESRAFRRRVHRGDYRRQGSGTAPVGG